MHPNWLGLIAALATLTVFSLTHNLGRKSRSPLRFWSAVIVTLLLAIPGATYTLYYTHLFPVPACYYTFRSWAGTEFLVIFLGVAGGLLASRIPRRLLILPLSGVALGVIVPVIKPLLGPIPRTAFRDQWQDATCLQSTPSTCGPASMASCLRFLGIHTTEMDLAQDAHSYVGGTEAWYLARAARAQGCQTRFRIATGFDPKTPLPAIVGVRLPATGHFIAILSHEDDQFLIADPLHGQQHHRLEDLTLRYAFSGFHLSLSKAPSD